MGDPMSRNTESEFYYFPAKGSPVASGRISVAAIEALHNFAEGDVRVSIKTGKKPVILPVVNNPSVAEYDSQEEAIAAATRQAGKDDGEYAVYIPIAIVRPKKDVTVETLK
jgi:hypothetical protein